MVRRCARALCGELIIAPAATDVGTEQARRRSVRYSRRMTDRTALCDELTATWHREIPIVAAMGVGRRQLRRPIADRARAAAAEPQRARHDVRGSLFSACVLTGWGAVWLALRERGLAGVIYAAESTIQYRKAVAGDFVCRCTPDADALDARARAVRSRRAARASISSARSTSDDKRAVTFTGKYVVHAKHA